MQKTVKARTESLCGAVLDWAVAKCEYPELVWGETIGLSAHARDLIVIPQFAEPKCWWCPSTYWCQGGPIIEREAIEIVKGNPLYFPRGNENGDFYEPLWIAGKQHGQTPLIAAMRCYVASKLGDEIEVPASLFSL